MNNNVIDNIVINWKAHWFCILHITVKGFYFSVSI